MPTTDLQFVAQMLRKVRAENQITSDESKRLDAIAEKGWSEEAVNAAAPEPTP